MNYLSARPKVTVDIAPLLESRWTGIPIFTRRLIQALMSRGGLNLEFMFQLTKIPIASVMTALKTGTGAYLREEFENGKVYDAEIAEPSSNLIYPSVKSGFGVATCEASVIHDISTLLMPEYHEESNVSYHLDHLPIELATDSVVFCISEATRSALLSAFPSVSDKARVLYQYVDWPVDFAMMDRDLPGLRLGRYAVVVGTIEPRKNLGLLVNALAAREIRGSSLRFVVIGAKGWKVDAFMAELPLEVRQRILFSGFVSEFIKYRLIKGAEFLIFPSVYEGFGIPTLEAMSLGKPVLCSWSSSLPEVVGDAGVYFDPVSVTDFAAALAMIEHPLKLAELAPIAIARNAAFNAQRMADPVIEWATAQ
jgi:glycosyltransferase involved in cell wall biosynthesis